MINASYDENNIFARILRDEMPATKVYEDDDTFAFMDIMPRGEGHCLVIPKAFSRNIFDVKPKDMAAVMTTVQKISRAAIRAFNADGITIQQFNEQASGQVVFHLHVHVIPRFSGVRLGPHTGEMEKLEILEANAAKIRAALEQIQ